MKEVFTEKEYLKAISKANKGDVIFFNETKGSNKSLLALHLAKELKKIQDDKEYSSIVKGKLGNGMCDLSMRGLK